MEEKKKKKKSTDDLIKEVEDKFKTVSERHGVLTQQVMEVREEILRLQGEHRLLQKMKEDGSEKE